MSNSQRAITKNTGTQGWKPRCRRASGRLHQRAPEHDAYYWPLQIEWNKATKSTGRVAFVLQSQGGNLCSRIDTELELSILWVKPRIKGRMHNSTDKICKARTQRTGSGGGVGTGSEAESEGSFVEGMAYRKWERIRIKRHLESG